MKFLTFLFVIATSLIAHAGGEKGNGGYSIVCRDDNEIITSAELLDIYEGRMIYRRNYPVQQKSIEEFIKLGRSRLSENHLYFQGKLDKQLAIVEKSIVLVPEGNILNETEDAFPPIKKKGCKFEQVANFTDGGELIIAQEIFDRLDNLNKAALYLHEAIYLIRRKAVGDTNSQVTRRIVSQLIASNPDLSVIDRWGRDTFYRPINKQSCGLEGAINDRIDSCSYTMIRNYNYSLVTRTTSGIEVWYDHQKNMLWSDRLAQTMGFDQAISACNKRVPEMADLKDYPWRLPSLEDFSGGGVLVLALPNMNHLSQVFWFWTATFRGRSFSTFNGMDGSLGVTFFKNSMGSVRCVANL